VNITQPVTWLPEAGDKVHIAIKEPAIITGAAADAGVAAIVGVMGADKTAEVSSALTNPAGKSKSKDKSNFFI
jgi:hypothetical protein